MGETLRHRWLPHYNMLWERLVYLFSETPGYQTDDPKELFFGGGLRATPCPCPQGDVKPQQMLILCSSTPL